MRYGVVGPSPSCMAFLNDLEAAKRFAAHMSREMGGEWRVLEPVGQHWRKVYVYPEPRPN